MKQLKLEKRRLQHEIDLKEIEIGQDYRNLIDILTFRNVLQVIADDIVAANTVVSKAYSVIKPLFKKRKKKKEEGRRKREEGRGGSEG
ncbi:MAG: hypothetical protein V1733_01150 [bacterium]